MLHHFGDREWARQRSTVGKLLSEAAGLQLDPVAHFEPSAHLADLRPSRRAPPRRVASMPHRF